MGAIEAGVSAGEAQLRRRRRVYELLDSADPARGRALRWCEQALGMYRTDGDMREARLLLRSALDCVAVADYPTIYRAWIAMEAEHEGDVGAARLFEEWRARDGGKDGGFWCHYLAFELDHGGSRRVRAVAAAAAAACPRDAAVHAKSAKAELRLGSDDRTFVVLGRALAALDGDAGAQWWLVDEVLRYRDAMREQRRWLTLRGSFRFYGGVRWPRPNIWFCLDGWWPRPPRGYERLRDEVHLSA